LFQDRQVVTVAIVKPEAQWYLVEQLSLARGLLGIRDDYEAKQNALAHFAGVLAAFRYVGDVTQDEEHAWYRRMLVALGYELPDTPSPGTAQAIYVGDPAKRPVHPPQPDLAPVFVRSLPGPDDEFEIYGGRLRIIAIEIYDTVVAVRWRVAPEPDIALAFPQESAALEQDLEGLEDWAVDDLRAKGRQRLRTMRLYRRFVLTDDVGTAYMTKGSSSGGGNHEMTGEARFQPGVPPTASVLTLSWLGLEVPIPIG
jgi:hypothetical protein